MRHTQLATLSSRKKGRNFCWLFHVPRYVTTRKTKCQTEAAWSQSHLGINHYTWHIQFICILYHKNKIISVLGEGCSTQSRQQHCNSQGCEACKARLGASFFYFQAFSVLLMVLSFTRKMLSEKHSSSQEPLIILTVLHFTPILNHSG